jgi:peptidyl-tRNA hydrolase, PTH1 family
MENVHLIAGLGNPGGEYAGTRHNAGFLFVDRLGARWRSDWREERRFNCRLAQAEPGGRRVLLCQPLTFMNASAEALGAVCAFYKIPASQVLVAVDDADLALGSLRLRPKGGTGGHHGLESVEQHLGTAEFARLRLGIAPEPRGPGSREITGHVLGRFAAGERPLLEKVLDRAAAQAECWLEHGIARAMNDYNGAVTAPPNESDRQ